MKDFEALAVDTFRAVRGAIPRRRWVPINASLSLPGGLPNVRFRLNRLHGGSEGRSRGTAVRI